MAYKSYDNSKYKLRTEWLNTYKNKNKLETYKPITIDFKSKNFFKKTYVIPFDYDKEGIPKENESVYENKWEDRHRNYEIKLLNFPEWVIPYISINCIGSTTDEYIETEDFKELDIDFHYLIKKDINTNINIFTIYIHVYHGYLKNNYPLYIKILITFNNPNNYYAIQKIKSQT